MISDGPRKHASAKAVEQAALDAAEKRLGVTISRIGFRRAVMELCGPECEEPELHLWPCLRGVLPDGWYVNRDRGFVIAVEHENTSRLTEAKLDRYAALFWAIDESGWQLDVMRVNNEGFASPLDLWKGALDYLVECAREQEAEKLAKA